MDTGKEMHFFLQKGKRMVEMKKKTPTRFEYANFGQVTHTQ